MATWNSQWLLGKGSDYRLSGSKVALARPFNPVYTCLRTLVGARCIWPGTERVLSLIQLRNRTLARGFISSDPSGWRGLGTQGWLCPMEV